VGPRCYDVGFGKVGKGRKMDAPSARAQLVRDGDQWTLVGQDDLEDVVATVIADKAAAEPFWQTWAVTSDEDLRWDTHTVQGSALRPEVVGDGGS